MKTRGASYSDYGMTNTEVEEWLIKCQCADNNMEQILLQAAQESNESISAELFYNLRSGISYDKLIVYDDIPINKVDFYGYRRKALFLVKEKTMRSEESAKTHFQDTGVIRRYCRVEDACEELQLGRTSLLRVADQARAVVKFGRFVRIDMTALYSYIDMECREGV